LEVGGSAARVSRTLKDKMAAMSASRKREAWPMALANEFMFGIVPASPADFNPVSCSLLSVLASDL
jgi:hypothetical protein